jgi:hypothetical protein
MIEKDRNYQFEPLGLPHYKKTVVMRMMDHNDQPQYRNQKFQRVENKPLKKDIILRLIEYLLSMP